jgi:hypothetical protein
MWQYPDRVLGPGIRMARTERDPAEHCTTIEGDTIMQESTFVYAALASWRGVKEAPKAAKHGMLSYDATCIYDARRSEPVAWPIGKGKKRAIVIGQSRGQRYGAWGRTRNCVATMVQRAIDPAADGTAIVLPYDVTPNAKSPDWREMAKDCAAGNHYAEAIAIARAIGMAVSKLPRPVYTASNYYTGRGGSNLQIALDALDPVKVKAKRVRERKERKYNEAVRAFDRLVAHAVNRDSDYNLATAACGRSGPSVQSIAAALGLPLNTYIKFVYASGQGTQRTSHQYMEDELSGLVPTAYVEPAIYRSGYHFTTIENWYTWATGDCYLVEPVGGIAGSQPDKHVAGSIRFVRKLGSAHDIQSAASKRRAAWDTRYGGDAWEARCNIEAEYRSFMIAPRRSDFGLED